MKRLGEFEVVYIILQIIANMVSIMRVSVQVVAILITMFMQHIPPPPQEFFKNFRRKYLSSLIEITLASAVSWSLIKLCVSLKFITKIKILNSVSSDILILIEIKPI